MTCSNKVKCAHIPHAPVTANAVNAFPITAEWGRCRDASFLRQVKEAMTGQLRISTETIKRADKTRGGAEPPCIPSAQIL